MQQADLPGFRKGKTPKNVIEKKFKDRIEEELRERLSRDVIYSAYENEDLQILGIDKVEREEFESDGTFSYITEVVCRPDVELTEKDYKGIDVDVVKQTVTDEMIQEFYGRVQRNFAEYEDTDEALQHNDKAMITYSAKTAEGNPLTDELEENMAPLAERDEEFELMIPEEGAQGYEMIPGLADAIVGLKAGDTKDVEVSFGDTYFIPALVGKEAVYSVKVESVQKAVLPEMNDELAQKAGAESLDDITEQYTMDLERQLEQNRIAQIDNQILEHLNKDHEFDLPQQQVFAETQQQVNQMMTNAYQQGMNPDEIEGNEDNIVDNATKRATANLRTRYLLDEIAKMENIDVSDQELANAVAYKAQQEGKSFKKLVSEMKRAQGFDALRGDILISKTIDFLRENANISETSAEDAESEADSDEE